MNRILYFVIGLIIHESAHYLTALLCGNKLSDIAVSITGFVACLQDDQISIPKKMIIMGGGAVGNFLFVIALMLIRYAGISATAVEELIRANLAIGAFNLIPVFPLDGGGLLFQSVYMNGGLNLAERVTRIATSISAGFIIILGIFQLIATGINPSLLIVGIYILAVKKTTRPVSILNMQNLLYRQKRIISKKSYEVRQILIMDSLSLSEVIKRLDYDRFHIIHIVNNKIDILKTVTEQEIITALKTHNAHERIGDIFS